jgi:hypothetical protein
MTVNLTWRDALTFIGLAFGALSLWWGFRQSRLAKDASEAERQVRHQLHQSQVIQRIAQLSVGLMRLHTLVRGEEFEFASEASWALMSDFSHVAGFCRAEMTEDEFQALSRMQIECGKIVVILSNSNSEEVPPSDLEFISGVCLEALVSVRRFQGRLEVLQDGSNSQRVN